MDENVRRNELDITVERKFIHMLVYVIKIVYHIHN